MAIVVDCLMTACGMWVARTFEAGGEDKPFPFSWENRGATWQDAAVKVLGRSLEECENEVKPNDIGRVTFAILPPVDEVKDHILEAVCTWDIDSLIEYVVEDFYRKARDNPSEFFYNYQSDLECDIDNVMVEATDEVID
jgi:hypothetical protein